MVSGCIVQRTGKWHLVQRHHLRYCKSCSHSFTTKCASRRRYQFLYCSPKILSCDQGKTKRLRGRMAVKFSVQKDPYDGGWRDTVKGQQVVRIFQHGKFSEDERQGKLHICVRAGRKFSLEYIEPSRTMVSVVRSSVKDDKTKAYRVKNDRLMISRPTTPSRARRKQSTKYYAIIGPGSYYKIMRLSRCMRSIHIRMESAVSVRRDCRDYNSRSPRY